jgi:hypothetical protein
MIYFLKSQLTLTFLLCILQQVFILIQAWKRLVDISSQSKKLKLGKALPI